jgi:hypothetical protein
MSLDPASIYAQLGRLIESAPDLERFPLSTDCQRWLGRAVALVQETCNLDDVLALKHHIDSLRNAGRRVHVQSIMVIVFRALAVAEIRAPASAQGAFIPAGNALDAMTAVGKVLEVATSDILIIDPYMDEKALTDFAVLASEGVTIRLLADQQLHKATLPPAVNRWVSQYGASRPMEARLAPARSLHDRLIALDGKVTWVLTQSLNAFAARSPASIVRSDPETAALKVAAYEGMWEASISV